MNRRLDDTFGFRYKRNILISVVCVLSLMIAVVNLWPLPDDNKPTVVYSEISDDPIEVDEIPASQQPQAPPPPPALPPPIEVADMIELEEYEIDLASDFSDEWFEDSSPPAPEGEFSSSPSPDVAARQLRLVEPTYSQEARQDGIRAQITIEVLVDESGDVKEAQIQEMLLLDENNRPKERVSHLGYGLEESALNAARRTTFVPAQSGGSTVRSRTTITIRFGV